MKNIFKKSIIMLCVFNMLYFCIFCAFAANSQTVVIRHINNGVAVEGAKVDLYRIGNFVQDEIIPEGGFANLPVSYSVSDTQDLSDLALTLEPFAIREGFVPTASSITDASGTTDFNEKKLPEGVYLLSVSTVRKDGVAYLASPVIFSLPYSQNGIVNDAVVLEVKSQSVPSGSEPISVKALKVWKNDTESQRNEQITVELLCDGKLYETKVLSKENGWSHTWKSLDPMSRWTVIEKDVPGFYKVGVTLEGITFVITNDGGVPTDELDETTTAKPDSDDKLPDTGSNIHLVPYVAIAGMLLLLAGYVRFRKSTVTDE